MGLLTKSERKMLGASDRRALRKERKLERRAERDDGKLERDVERWGGAAINRMGELIHEMAETDISGEDKLDEVLDIMAEELAEDLDDAVKWKWMHAIPVVGTILAIALEAGDGPLFEWAIKGMLRPVVRRIYRGFKSEGVL